jgi:hypothetical protein
MCVSAAHPASQRTTVVNLGDVRIIADRLGKVLDDFDALDCN